MALNGRFHYYEGYGMDQVTFPVRVMKFLGIERMIVSNAAGGVNPEHEIGDIMLISDHINMIPEHPLRGRNLDKLGPRFVDMKDCYNPAMRALAHKIADDAGYKVCEGVYLGGWELLLPLEFIEKLICSVSSSSSSFLAYCFSMRV